MESSSSPHRYVKIKRETCKEVLEEKCRPSMNHVILLSVSTIHRDRQWVFSIWYPKRPSCSHATFSVLRSVLMCLFTFPKEPLTTPQIALISQLCKISKLTAGERKESTPRSSPDYSQLPLKTWTPS